MTSQETQVRVLSASREIAAGAGTIFELIADPALQPSWDGNDNLAVADAGQRVHGVDEVFRDPQVLAQKMVLEVEQPGHGLVRMLGFPMKFAETPCEVRRPAPELGEHSEEVLAELGYDALECARHMNSDPKTC